jgi:hypothetical protein
MQTRPLHMVLARGDLPNFFGHAVEGVTTRVSITSARESAGRIVWQIGGQLAEAGVALDAHALIAQAQHELRAVLPGLSLADTQWATYRIDRAEGATATGGRPESFRLLDERGVLTAWPTKLVLAPQLAQAVLAKVVARATKPVESALMASDLLRDWPRPTVALPPWEQPHEWIRFTARKAAA